MQLRKPLAFASALLALGLGDMTMIKAVQDTP